MPVALGIANSPVFSNLVVGGSVTPPDAPTNLAAVVNGSDVDLTWTDNSTDEDGFKIYRSSDNIVFVEIDDIAAGSTAYTDLDPGSGTWYYYVVAYNAGGESDSNVASVFIGALDSVPNMVHIYDIARRWVSSYSGNLVRLRRNSDNAELDFTYVANGDLDVAAINTWLGGASGFVVTIYDQKSGDDVSQATAARQPLYAESGQNGRPVSRWDGTLRYLRTAFTNGGSLSQPFSTYAVATMDASIVNDNQLHYIHDSDDSTNRMILAQYAPPAPDAWGMYGGAWLAGGASNADANVWATLFNGGSSQFWHNGISQVSGNAGVHNADGITIGAVFSVNSSFWKGDIAPIIIADPSHGTTDRVTVQNALGDYYGITIT